MKRVDMMGKVVLVRVELEPLLVYPHDGRIIRNIVCRGANRAGWVTGFSWLCEGNKVMIDLASGLVLEETKRIPCVLVAYWHSMRPVKVPLDGYEYPTEVEPESPSARTSRLWLKANPAWTRKVRGQWIVERSKR